MRQVTFVTWLLSSVYEASDCGHRWILAAGHSFVPAGGFLSC